MPSSAEMSSTTKRGLGVGVSAVLMAAACWSVVVACGTDEEQAAVTPDEASSADATPQPAFDSGTSTGNDAAGSCEPVAPKRPAPTPPKRFQPGACTTEQVDGYVKECLQSDGKKCKTYKTANATCAACAESKSEDPAWGPIVFYENDRYYDYNYGGCIANVLDDFTAAGCGAAETRYLECRHAACVGCLPDSLPIDYKPFFACQNSKATETICAAEQSEVGSACAKYFAGKPTDACQGAGLSSDDYLRRLIGGWCVGTAGDAGDGGDGGS
jgi:hypothetical protein